MDRSLSVQSILCKIFQFLDLKSLLKCDLVNKQWLNDARQPASVYHLNMDDIFNRLSPAASTIKGLKPGECDYNVPQDLTRFKNVESVSFCKLLTYSYNRKIIKFCESNFSRLQKIKKIAIRVDLLLYAHDHPRHAWKKILRNLLFINMNHLVAIKLSTNSSVASQSQEPWIWSFICENGKHNQADKDDKMDEKKLLSFPELRQLTVSYMNLYSFPKILHNNGLKVLKIFGGSFLGRGFWNDLIKYKENISNIEEICLNGCFVHVNDYNYLTKNVLPVICARIMQKNLTRLECVGLKRKCHEILGSRVRQLTYLNGFIWKYLVEKIYENINNTDFIDIDHDLHKDITMVKFDCQASVQQFNSVELSLKPLNQTREVLSSLKLIRLDCISHDRYHCYVLPNECHGHIGEMICNYNINTNKLLLEGDNEDILTVLAMKRDDKSDSSQAKSEKMSINTPALRTRFAHARSKNRRLALKLESGKKEQKKDEKDRNDSIESKNLHLSPNFSSLFTLGNTSIVGQQGDDQIKFEFGNKEKDNNNWSFSFDTSKTTGGNTGNENKNMIKSNNYNFCSFDYTRKDDKMNDTSINTSSAVFTFNSNETKDKKHNNSNSDNRGNKLLNTFSLAKQANNYSRIGFDFAADSGDKGREKRFVSFFQRLIIHGHNKITLQYICRTLNKIEFWNNCLEYVKIDGVKSICENDGIHVGGISKIKRALMVIKGFLCKHNYPKFDIKLKWKINEVHVNECALQLVELLSLLYNDFAFVDKNNNNNNNSGDIFRLVLAIEMRYAQITRRDITHYFSFQSDWIETICNGITNIGKNMHDNDDNEDNDDKDTGSDEFESKEVSQRRIMLPAGFVNINFLQKQSGNNKCRWLMMVEFTV